MTTKTGKEEGKFKCNKKKSEKMLTIFTNKTSYKVHICSFHNSTRNHMLIYKTQWPQILFIFNLNINEKNTYYQRLKLKENTLQVQGNTKGNDKSQDRFVSVILFCFKAKQNLSHSKYL